MRYIRIESGDRVFVPESEIVELIRGPCSEEFPFGEWTVGLREPRIDSNVHYYRCRGQFYDNPFEVRD